MGAEPGGERGGRDVLRLGHAMLMGEEKGHVKESPLQEATIQGRCKRPVNQMTSNNRHTCVLIDKVTIHL